MTDARSDRDRWTDWPRISWAATGATTGPAATSS